MKSKKKKRDSRGKGARFELMVSKMFSEAFSLDIRRTPLSGGWSRDNPDVAGDLVCVKPYPEAFPFTVECKNVEGWRLESLFIDGGHGWMDSWWFQLIEECGEGKIPLLVFSRAYAPTFVAFRMDELDVDSSPVLWFWDLNIMLLESLLDDENTVTFVKVFADVAR